MHFPLFPRLHEFRHALEEYPSAASFSEQSFRGPRCHQRLHALRTSQRSPQLLFGTDSRFLAKRREKKRNFVCGSCVRACAMATTSNYRRLSALCQWTAPRNLTDRKSPLPGLDRTFTTRAVTTGCGDPRRRGRGHTVHISGPAGSWSKMVKGCCDCTVSVGGGMCCCRPGFCCSCSLAMLRRS